ncbi:PREDICTED: pre-mRNA-splicing factor SPF27-like isoform X2 [Amphimedon queenslandica]|uniref:Pre-mRNA-splicing factor SPF27 n=1 Tax=Amphimedon queenslandica TaxID=400682 RepID=A0AAN0JBF2_AMPQE|nr:PREDICTED: pre-mRNA-splicing factor SPF27-like isoform X2 [Amphimedon queenslandica]|eukprot:XP_019854314.1 PREDICTED: pre-mRNA-splicing factor SPF27-like isoform X2 [Amphimedon queenslandica]
MADGGPEARGGIGDSLVDALPYIDKEYDDPGLKDAALQLIDEETKRYRPTKNYIDYLPVPRESFESPLLKIEMDRLASRQPMETLSMKRYELPQPSAAQKNDVGAWQDSVSNSCAQLEHQNERIVNLELLSQYGSNEWRLHNENQVQEVNWQRKTEQTNVGTQLEELNNHWMTLVYRNFEIERECLKVQRENEFLKRKAEERQGQQQQDDES